ncbi:MAG: glycine zipper domain-containing protein [Acidocella sp.]|nr:glycine zipper domain-containing protein [Acidocella sp.]
MLVHLRRLTPAAAALVLLTGCQPAPPTGPTITVMPGPHKTLTQFQNDDYTCRNFAQNQSYQAPRTGLSSPVGTTAATTVGGAAAGALLGAAAGNAGMGAAIGAGAGLLGGSAYSVHENNQQGASTQQSYNTAYAQCMKTRGNSVPPM